MATTRQAISVGSNANDGTGDTLRAAGQKINSNFGALYNFLGGDSDSLATQISLNDEAIVFTKGLGSTTFGTGGTSAPRTIDLPNASGTVTLNEATQTLTNKNITMTRSILDNTDVSSASDSPIANTSGPYIRCTGTGYQVTLADGDASEIGTLKVFTYTGTNTLQVLATGGNFNLTTDQSKILIWTGTEWIQLT